jgi:SPX domain protein involved in polyphosphate accumulation
MKFGKKLLSAEDVSPDAWHGKWLDYKKLKKLIGAIVDEQKGKKAQREPGAVDDKQENRCTNATEMGKLFHYPCPKMLAITRLMFLSARYSSVRDFFKQLNEEITKIATFFAQEQKNLSVKATSVSLLAERVVQSCGKAGQKRMLHPTAHDKTVQECVSFHKELLMLESYAVLNYCGLSKITKKHDKITGFVTRQKFMVNVVNKQPFAHYAALKVLLQRTEGLFEQLVSFHRYPPFQFHV